MSKKTKQIIAGVGSALIIGLTACLAVFLPRNTRADETSIENVFNSHEAVEFNVAGDMTGALCAEQSDKGGSIFLEPGAEFTLDGGTLSGYDSKYGGAVYVSKGAKFTMTGGTITNTFARFGGAIYVEQGGYLEITGGTIENCWAENGYAIYIETGETLDNMPFDLNNYVKLSNSIVQDSNVHGIYDYTMNYFTDGLLRGYSDLSRKEIQNNKATFLHFDAPLNYEECMGYFIDAELKTAIEHRELVDLNDNGDGYIYTKEATNNLIFASTTVTTADGAVSGYSVANSTSNPASGEIVIPRWYKGKEVIKISDNGFNGEITGIGSDGLETITNEVTAIYMPETMRMLGVNSISNQPNIESLYIRKNVVALERCGVASCEALTSLVVADDNLVYTSKINLPKVKVDGAVETFNVNAEEDDMKTVDANAIITKDTSYLVVGCKKSFRINIATPKQEETIDSSGDVATFIQSNAKKIKKVNADSFDGKVNVPNSIKGIADYAFYKCEGLTSIDCSKNEMKVIIGGVEYVYVIEGGEGINYIGAYSFFECSNLKRISCTSSETISKIGISAFENCTTLEMVSLNSNGVTEISNRAFYGCKNMDFSSNAFTYVEKIGNYAFDGCLVFGSLTDEDGNPYINFDNNSVIKNVGSYAFNGTKIKSANFNSTLTTIGDGAFNDCSELKEIIVPSSVSSYGSYPFDGCSALKKIQIFSSAVTSFDKDNYGGGANLEYLSIPCNVNNNDLRGLVYLKTVILNPTGDITLSANAFEDCSNLQTFECSKNVTSIGQYAFAGTKINKVTIDMDTTKKSSLTNGVVIKPSTTASSATNYSYAFSDCDYLEDVYINWNNDMPANMFRGSEHNHSSDCLSDCEIGLSIVVDCCRIFLKDSFSYVNIKSLIINNSALIQKQAFYYFKSDYFEVVNCGQIESLSFVGINCIDFKLSDTAVLNLNSYYIYDERYADISPNHVYAKAITGTVKNLYLPEKYYYKLPSSIKINTTYLHIANFSNWCDTDFVCANNGVHQYYKPDRGDYATQNYVWQTPMYYAKYVVINGEKSARTSFEHQGENVYSHCYQGPAVRSVILTENVKRIYANAFECENLSKIVFDDITKLVQFGSESNYKTSYDKSIAPNISASPFTLVNRPWIICKISDDGFKPSYTSCSCSTHPARNGVLLDCTCYESHSTCNEQFKLNDEILDILQRKVPLDSSNNPLFNICDVIQYHYSNSNRVSIYANVLDNSDTIAKYINNPSFNLYASTDNYVGFIYEDGSGILRIPPEVKQVDLSAFVDYAEDPYTQSSFLYFDYKTDIKTIIVEEGRTSDLTLSLPLNSLETLIILGSGYTVAFNTTYSVSLEQGNVKKTYYAENLKNVFLSKGVKVQIWDSYNQCSDDIYSELEDLYIERASYCECNIFKILERDGGGYESICDHGNIQVREAVVNGIDNLASSFKNLKSGYTDTKYTDFINKGNAFSDLADHFMYKYLLGSTTKGAIFTINTNSYTPKVLESGYSTISKENLRTIVARLLGFSDVNVFIEKANQVADILSENPLDASTSTTKQRMVYDGAIYTSSGLYVLPYAMYKGFSGSEGYFMMYLFVDPSTKEMFVWINDIDKAYKLANIDLINDEDNDLYIRSYGRCYLFSLAPGKLYGANNPDVIIGSDADPETAKKQFGENWYYTKYKYENNIEQNYVQTDYVNFELNYLGDNYYPEFVITTDSNNRKWISGINANVMYRKTELVIPAGIYGIKANAFNNSYYCQNIVKVTIRSGLVEIQANAFSGMTNLRRIFIPSSVTTINSSLLNGCSNLIRVYTDKSSSLGTINNVGSGGIIYNTSFEYFAKVGCSTDIQRDVRFDVQGTEIIKYFGSETHLEIPDVVTKIREEAFKGCSTIQILKLNKNLQQIHQSAFEGCYNLIKVYFEDNNPVLGVIRENAFASCPNLTWVYFASNNNYFNIVGNPFANSGTAEGVVLRIFFKTSSKNNNWDSSFDASNRYGVKRENYYNVSYSDFEFIQDCEIREYKGYYPCLGRYKGSQTKIVIPSIFKGIAPFAFSTRSEETDKITIGSSNIVSVDMGNGVEYIAPLAFFGCFDIQLIYISRNVKWIETYNVEDIDAIVRLVFATSKTIYIGYKLFEYFKIKDYHSIINFSLKNALCLILVQNATVSPFTLCSYNLNFYVQADRDNFYDNAEVLGYETFIEYKVDGKNGYCYEKNWTHVWPLQFDIIDSVIDWICGREANLTYGRSRAEFNNAISGLSAFIPNDMLNNDNEQSIFDMTDDVNIEEIIVDNKKYII